MIENLRSKGRYQWYTFTYVSIFISVTYTLFPIILTLPSLLRRLFVISYLGTAFLGVILRKSWYRSNNLLSLFCVFILVVILYFGKWKYTNFLLGRNINMISQMISLFQFWIFWIISKNSIEFSDSDKEKILKYCLLLIDITSITTIIGCFKYPMAPRELAGIANVDDAALYRGLNIGGYEFIYGITLMVPFMMYLIYKAESKNSKLIYIASLGLMLIAIIISQYATALVISATAIIFSIILFFIRSKKGQVILITIVGIIVVLLISGAIIQILTYVRDVLLDSNLDTMSIRVDEIIHFFESNRWDGTSGVRVRLRTQSFSVFCDSPIYGCMFSPKSLGGHSELLDILGAGGIIGLTAFLVPLLNFFKLIETHNKDALFKMMLFIENFVFILLAYVNTIFVSSNISLVFFLIPTLLIHGDNDKTESKDIVIKKGKVLST